MGAFPWGAIATAGSSILGGLFGKSEASKNRAMQRNFIQMRVADAKKAGIHPLAALGASGGAQSVHSGMGDAVASAGAAIGKSIANRELQQLNKEKIRSDINRNNAEAQGWLADAQRTTTNAALRAGAIGGAVPTKNDPYKKRTENQYMSVKLADGSIIEVPNPDVYEIGPTELATGSALLGGSLVGKTLDEKTLTPDEFIDYRKKYGF